MCFIGILFSLKGIPAGQKKCCISHSSNYVAGCPSMELFVLGVFLGGFLVRGAPHRIVLRCTPFPLCQPTFLIFQQISECSHYGQKSKFKIMELATSKAIAITDNITDKNSKLQCLDKQESTRHE